jgi:hypothetical protein
MTLLESARGASTYAPERMDDSSVSDGQVLNSNASGAWAPREKPLLTVEDAVLPFTKFAIANGEQLTEEWKMGSKSWGYARRDSVLNPDGGRCNASSTSMKCGPETGARQYRGSNSDVPQLYANQETINGQNVTKQYFAPVNEVPAVSPETHRYLTPVKYDNTEVASVIDRAERFEKALDRPISWRNNSLEAFVEAVENDKPMVVVFGDNSSPMFRKQMAELQADKDRQMASLSERAIFVIGKPNEDENARRMASHLKLTDYPTISVIAPRTDQLTETYRMEGYFSVSQIFSDLNAALPAAKPKLRPNTVVA